MTAEAGAPAACDEAAAVPVTSGDAAVPGDEARAPPAAPASPGPAPDPAPPAGRALIPPPGSPFPPFAHLPVVVRREIATLTCRPEDACDATWTAPDAQYPGEAAMAAGRREGWGYGGGRPPAGA